MNRRPLLGVAVIAVAVASLYFFQSSPSCAEKEVDKAEQQPSAQKAEQQPSSTATTKSMPIVDEEKVAVPPNGEIKIHESEEQAILSKPESFSKSFVLSDRITTVEVSFVVLALDESFFIYVGLKNKSILDSLVLANGQVASSLVGSDNQNENIASALLIAKRTKKVIHLSCQLGAGGLGGNADDFEVRSLVERELVQYILNV